MLMATWRNKYQYNQEKQVEINAILKLWVMINTIGKLTTNAMIMTIQKENSSS